MTASREALNAYARRWRAANRVKATAASTAASLRWKAANPERAELLRRVAKVNAHSKDRGGSGRMSIADLEAVIAATNGKCSYCDVPTTELDHRVPICRGGTTSVENVTLCCRACNRRKGTQTPQEFLGQVVRLCRVGHPLEPSNTYVSPKSGQRMCATCKREGDRERRPRKESTYMDRCEAMRVGVTVGPFGFTREQCEATRGLVTFFDVNGKAHGACPALGHRDDVVRRFGREDAEDRAQRLHEGHALGDPDCRLCEQSYDFWQQQAYS